MCEICLKNPCDYRCPNFDESETVFTKCSNCNSNIYYGYDYYVINEENWCEDCIGDCKKEAEGEKKLFTNQSIYVTI